jgi:Uma2 family endonuclease
MRAALPQPRRFSVAEYHRMSELGILAAQERTELLNGEILPMVAKGTAHSSATTRSRQILERLILDRAIVRVQEPIVLNDRSEPEPDIAVVTLEPLEYATHHPTPSQVLLLIEVADSSWQYDTEIKMGAYAQAGILDYWVLDVQERRLQIFRQPGGAEYGKVYWLSEEATIAPLAFPDLCLSVLDLLPLT